MSKAKPPACLMYAGTLGHRWASTYTDSDGVEHLRCECNEGPHAVETADEDEAAGRPARIWNRTRKGWREVTRSLAMIS